MKYYGLFRKSGVLLHESFLMRNNVSYCRIIKILSRKKSKIFSMLEKAVRHLEDAGLLRSVIARSVSGKAISSNPGIASSQAPRNDTFSRERNSPALKVSGSYTSMSLS